MRVDQQIVFSVHRITVRCNGTTPNEDGVAVPCMRQASVYVSGGMAGSLEEQLAQIGWWGREGDWHLCLEHS